MIDGVLACQRPSKIRWKIVFPHPARDFFRAAWLPSVSGDAVQLKTPLAEEDVRLLEFAVVRRCARTIFLAMHAVAMVVESSLRRSGLTLAYLNRECDLLVSRETLVEMPKSPDITTIGRKVLLNEISGVAVIPFEAAQRLSQWVFDAARQHKHLFLELDSHPAGDLVGLSLTSETNENLYNRWALPKQ